MEHILYWIWLTTIKNIASAKIAALLEHFGSVEEIYASRSFRGINGLSDEDAERLCKKDLSEAQKILEETARIGAKIVVYDNENYPNILRHIFDPPYVLYILGKVPELDKVLTIGIVGTRGATDYGRLVTERITRSLAEAGAVTIGGLARGIDTVGAWTTLEAGGIAVGVIGSGLDRVYPMENAELMKEMSKNGCVMSEYPPGTPPLRQNFPMRNRIIAGLSRGVLVTEAPLKSGALITAKYALEYNRDVFAVPRNITDGVMLGGNTLIARGEAKLVMTAEDILSEYPYSEKITPIAPKAPKRAAVKAVSKKTPPRHVKDMRIDALKGNEKTVAELIRENSAGADEIAAKLDIPVNELNTVLTMLEIKGIIKKLPGSSYEFKI